MAFLKRIEGCDALYILGDFFEVWLGDDYTNPYIDQINQALIQLTDSGTQLYFMHGNRDFLIGQDWCNTLPCTLLEAPHTVTLGDTQVLLMHGDELCTDDVDYMKARIMLRNPAWQSEFLSKPIEQRIAFAQQLRSESIDSQKDKSDDIMDVNQQAVDQAMDQASVNLMIHGHTHRPKAHRWQHQGHARSRYVLGDWGNSDDSLPALGWMIRYQPGDDIRLESFTL